ncbi:MAG: 50S ribosomal protein L13 [Ignavibacteria bacterium]|nr:50S ribosomal protein L13 [Ignavibacteria bacterium]MBK9404920.1 50S ribosomal protein L13 [Ignavibacteria bacterium]
MKAGIKKTNKVTKFATAGENPHKWHIVDANGKILGRMASEIAKRIRGKYNPQYTPNADTGDWVVVINAEKVKLAGKRADQKEYLTYSGYPGGQKKRTFNEMIDKHPDRVITLAVKRMLPKTRLGNKLINKLKVYKGEEHPHTAQNPVTLEV